MNIDTANAANAVAIDKDSKGSPDTHLGIEGVVEHPAGGDLSDLQT
jgi:hypothetical protein